MPLALSYNLPKAEPEWLPPPVSPAPSSKKFWKITVPRRELQLPEEPLPMRAMVPVEEASPPMGEEVPQEAMVAVVHWNDDNEDTLAEWNPPEEELAPISSSAPAISPAGYGSARRPKKRPPGRKPRSSPSGAGGSGYNDAIMSATRRVDQPEPTEEAPFSEILDPRMRSKAIARTIMKAADRHARNGSLTVNEMNTYLAGTAYEGFVTWMTFYYRGASGAHQGRSNLAQFDTDGDGALDLQEVEGAVLQYLHETPPDKQFRSSRGPGSARSSMSRARSHGPPGGFDSSGSRSNSATPRDGSLGGPWRPDRMWR